MFRELRPGEFKKKKTKEEYINCFHAIVFGHKDCEQGCYWRQFKGDTLSRLNTQLLDILAEVFQCEIEVTFVQGCGSVELFTTSQALL